MDINQIFQFAAYESNKWQSGAISPQEFNIACIVASTELFNVKCGLPEDYKPGAPYPPQAYAVTQKNIDDLSPYINHHFVITKNTAGYFPKPANYYAFSSLSYNYVLNDPDCKTNPTSTQRFIQLLDDGEWRIRIPNSIIMPTVKDPIAKLTNTGFEIMPNQIKTIFLTYLQAPVPPVFGYTIVNDEAVYNAGLSTQPDFPATLHTEFAWRIVRYIAVNLRDEGLEKMALQRLISGQ